MTQAEALDILKMGKNVFLTGPAGSGKTHVLNDYIKYLKSHGIEPAVTASTGIAATHLGGQTVHSWSGLGVRDILTDRDIDEMMQKQYLYKRFKKTKVLIIDEISMLHHFRLEMVDWICREMKHSSKPFGGIQVIFSGDFFQLPPVIKNSSESLNLSPESQFAYKAESWQTAKLTICHITEQHRQSDNFYLSVLENIRSGNVSQKTIDLLRSCLNKELSKKGYTKLYTHNIDVDIINHRHLSTILEKEKKFKMTSRGGSLLVESLKKGCLSPEILTLKIGARVMCTKNNSEAGYVNGTLGIIIDFNPNPVIRINSGRVCNISPSTWQIEEEGKVKAEITQIPLRLAWAITVHKSQGISLDAMEADLSKSFVRGMGYVALSRVRSLSDLRLIGLNDMALEVDGEVLEKDKEFQKKSETAQSELKSLPRKDIQLLQKAFLDSIKPKQKLKLEKPKSKWRWYARGV